MAGVFRKSLSLAASRLASASTMNSACSVGGRFANRVSMPVARRNFWHMTGVTTQGFQHNSLFTPRVSTPCTSGCNRQAHTEDLKDDQAISKFLEEEIKLEKKSEKFSSQLPKLEGWTAVQNGAEVTLEKQLTCETIKIFFNINNSVDADEPIQVTEDDTKPGEEQVAHMISKPDFLVEVIKKSGKTLAVRCSFPPHEEDFGDEEGKTGDEETFMDQFEIEEVTVHDGKWKETVFSVPATTMDGTLYDLLMDKLDDLGVTDEFISKFVDYSTTYEHGRYVGFLQDLKTFVDEK